MRFALRQSQLLLERFLAASAEAKYQRGWCKIPPSSY